MADPSVLFSWHVPKAGFRWTDSHSIPPVHDRREPFLTIGRNPDDRSAWAKRYRPLEQYTGLFRVFAEVEPQREAILAFAERFGSLGGALTTSIPLYDRPLGKGYASGWGESLREWAGEIMAMRWAVELWEAARHGDEQELRSRIIWDDDRMRVRFETHPHVAPAETLQIREPATWATIAMEGDGMLEQFVPGDVVQPALFHVQQLANKHLRGQVSPRLLWDEERTRLHLFLVPEGLIGGLWLQFARAIQRDNEFRRCLECDLWFELAPGTARSDKLYCSNACRTKGYRRRQAEAVRLHGEGRQVAVIAEQLQTEVEIVRGWIERHQRGLGASGGSRSG